MKMEVLKVLLAYMKILLIIQVEFINMLLDLILVDMLLKLLDGELLVMELNIG